jgi:hypothetical protein
LQAIGDDGLDAKDRALRAAALAAAQAATRAPARPQGRARAVSGSEIESTIAQARRLLDETADLGGAATR